MLISFDLPSSIAGWYAINDGVMGGASLSRIEHDATGHARFAGTVSFECNGGFASVRSPVLDAGGDAVLAYVLTVRGDGKTYKLSLRVDEGFDGINYQARFVAPPGDWCRIRLPLHEFAASWRGRPLPDAPPLAPARVRQIGLLIADRQAGPFSLELRAIESEP